MANWVSVPNSKSTKILKKYTSEIYQTVETTPSKTYKSKENRNWTRREDDYMAWKMLCECFKDAKENFYFEVQVSLVDTGNV